MMRRVVCASVASNSARCLGDLRGGRGRGMLSRGVQRPEYDAGDAERDDRLGVSAQFRRMFDYMDWRALYEGTRAWRARGCWIGDSALRSPGSELNCGADVC